MPRKPTGPKSGSVSRFYWGWVMSLKVELITGPCTPHLHGIFFSIHLLLIYMSSSLKWISCRIHRVGSCFFVYSDNIFSPPVLWRCYWQKLCIFKVCKMFWYVYTLWNVYPSQLNTSITLYNHHMCVCVCACVYAEIYTLNKISVYNT